jgi:predicted 3-demethylubiquinone-9 3-methyltransferase (glyoxalase superfamily)
MQKISTFLWYDHQAEEAANHYVSVFSSRPGAASAAGDSRITNVSRTGEAGPGGPGSVMIVNFLLEGQEFIALNGGPAHDFTEAISLFVRCDSQQEVDHFWDRLLADGGREDACGWLKDRYGLSWQIIPNALMDLMGDPNPAKAQAVMGAMLEMKKIEIDGLRRAYEAA